MERKFGDYELVRPLGRGGMGVVYEAIQLSLGRRVALKMILDSDGASPAALRRFTLEAETVARLDHPNIVPLYQIGEVNGQPFLSMKLIAGETLRNKIANHEIGINSNDEGIGRDEFREKLNRLVRLVIGVADAVQHAHEHGILHRDLKPGNILVDEAGEPHLLDFGLAKILQADSKGAFANNTEPNGRLGTPTYMSPEQADGKPLAPASDIHSLGAILYEMLCGVPPFAAATPVETLRKVIEHQPIRPRSINARLDKDLDTISMRCLEKSPAARYPSARALAEDLGRWLRHEPIHARPAGIPLRVTRWVARNKLGTALIGSLCIGLTVALVFLRQSLEHQRTLDLRRANSLQLLSANIEDMWRDPEQRSVRIASATLADLADLAPRLNDPTSTQLILGNSINHEPFGQAQQYAPFLHEMEARMEKSLAGPVLISLNLYKAEADALRDMERGKLHFQRMPAAAYVLARRSVPGLHPLVRERRFREGVIFAAKGSGITNLAQVTGKRLVLGQTTSDYAFWGKVQLARAGVTASALCSCTYMRGGTGTDESGTSHSEKKMMDRDPNLQAHRRVVQEVLRGEADVGVAPRRQFELSKYRTPGLVELYSFAVSNEVYVGAPGLSSKVAQALQESLVSFASPDKEALARLEENPPTEGFEKISDEDFTSMRIALEKEIADFERNSEDRKR